MPASEEFDATLTYLAVLAGQLNPAENQDVRRLVRQLVGSRRQVGFRQQATRQLSAEAPLSAPCTAQ